MKKIIFVFMVLALFAFVATSAINKVSASANLCFLCGSGSSCQQCPSDSGKDTQADRKKCEAKGCKVSGTTSCSSAVNVKKCQ